MYIIDSLNTFPKRLLVPGSILGTEIYGMAQTVPQE